MAGWLRQGLLKYFSEAQLTKIEAVRVGIAGAGGLGSNCAMNLVRSGFCRLVIADFDVVEPGNLNRQFFFPDQCGRFKVEALEENLRRLNPDLELRTVKERIDAGNVRELFADCQVIVEAFDGVESKRMLAEAFFRSDKLVVSASGLAGWQDSDRMVTRRVHRNFYLVGDMETEVSAEEPPCSPRVNIAAAKEANLVLAYALGDL